MSTPFAGVRVVDALGGLLGGYCTKMLADAGAEVTLLEGPDGDELRHWRIGGGPDGGALFDHLRAGQRAVAAAGPAALREWATAADCVIVGCDGPDPDELAADDPSLVVVSITPYGRTGPWADRPATDFTLQADAGGLTIRGRPDRPPYHAGGRTGDWFSAVMAATATAAALRRRARAGAGAVIDLSRAECTTLAMTNYASLMASLRGPKALRFPPAITETPAVEPTADGYVVFTTNTRRQLDSFCLLLGRPELAEQYASAASRQMDWENWNGIVHDWTTARTSEEILAAAAELRIPVAPVCNGATVTAVDHFAARGVYRRDPTDRFTAPRRPWAIAGEPVPEPRPAPGPAVEAAPPEPEPTAATGTADSGADADSAAMALPLAGVRVLDTTAWWAGPMATWVLATLGADVIHVEAADRPDGMRLVGGAFADQPQWWDRSWFFLSANTNKRDLTLDLDDERGRDLYLRLVEQADVVVENYTPRVFDQFGLTRDALRERNPSLLFARMPAFGLDGPWRDRPGFAQTMESLSGLAWVTGHVDDQPRLQGGPCDPNAGVHAAFAIIAALVRRDATGEGGLLEIPMVESALNIGAEQVIEHSAHGTLVERAGNRGPYAAPQGLYRAGDGWLAVAVATPIQWEALCRVVDELAGVDRHDHDATDAVLAAWAGSRDPEAAAVELCAAGVPAAVARDPRRTPEHPQYRARGFYEEPDHPVVGPHLVPGLPLRLSGTDRWIRRSAPTLGEHNPELLAGVGVGADELARLTAEGVIGTSPSR